MAETIKIPFVGQVKTGYAIAGGGAVVVIVGYAYWRHSQNSAANAANSQSSTADQTATDQSNIDPQTGFPYGSPEDQSALASLYGSPGFGGIGGFGVTQPTTITNTVTVTKELVGVPSVVGAGQVRAISAIKRAGLVPDPSITIPGDGNVTSQTPAAGTEVRKGTIVHWDAKPVKGPGHNDKSFIANGSASLIQSAQSRHVTVNEIITLTEQHDPGKLVRDYIDAGDFHKRLPRGSKWYF